MIATLAAAMGLIAPEARARKQPATVEAQRLPEALPGDVVITGERLPRRVRDTPSSVVVITGGAIEAGTDDRIDQLFAAVPNVQVGSGEEGPAIRGQDSTGVSRGLFAFLGGTRPRVTLQVDGRAVSFYEYVSGSAPLWDVDHVEVFRSPQTTTQGRNSIAGAIFVQTRDPEFEWKGKARLLAGEIGTRQASAVITGPLAGDELAVRLSGDIRRGRMASDLADGIPGADIRRDDYGQARLKLLYRPAEVPGMRIETSLVHTSSQAPPFEAVAPPFKQRRFPTPDRTNGILRVGVTSLTTTAIVPLAAALETEMTVSGGDANLRRFGLPGLGDTRVDNKDASLEALLRWTPAGPLQVVAGLRGALVRQKQWIDITGLGLGIGGFRDRQKSAGLFGEARWQPIEHLAITGGMRLQWDRQDRVGQVGVAPTGIRADYHQSFSALLPKLSVAYAISDAVNAGILVQRAFNPGGTSVSLVRRAEDRFEAERLTNLEGFVRAGFAGGRGTLSANLFANWIENSQRQLLVPVVLPNGATIFSAEFANAPKATSHGLEAEFGWRVDRRLNVRAGLGLLRTRLDQTLLPNDPTLGKEFQRSPRLSASASVEWKPTDAIRLSAQVRHHGRYFSDDANTPVRQIGAASFVDLRAAWEWRQLTLFGYARNAFNRLALTYLFSPTFGTAEDPREAGAGIELRF
ncbi:TonB-dependent receptor [Sphingomonas humi]|uniref:TonB-dependent receptor n=1 Tax=Sphingomonas humi TaxID=335630 RepID=A0ABP7SEF9_9SPHN